MPPSGYSMAEAKAIRSFLHSCSSALMREGRALGKTACQALRDEIADIDRVTNNDASADAFVTPVLRLTRDFYHCVLDKSPSSFEDFPSAVDKALENAVDAILRIHIEPINSAVR